MKNPVIVFDLALITIILLVAVGGWMMQVVPGSLGAPLVVQWQWQHYAAPLCGLELILVIVGFIRVAIILVISFLPGKTEEPRTSNTYYLWGYDVALVVGLIFALPIIFSGGLERSGVGAASGDIGAFNSALALYQVDLKAKTFPTTMGQLLSDNAPGWSGPYLATISADPWGNTYTYTGGASNYTILSIHHSDYHKSETVRYILGEGILSTLP